MPKIATSQLKPHVMAARCFANPARRSTGESCLYFRPIAVKAYALPWVALTANALARDLGNCLDAGMMEDLSTLVTAGALAVVVRRNCKG